MIAEALMMAASTGRNQQPRSMLAWAALAACVAAATAAAGDPVTLSNVQLPLDTAGKPLTTGEASVLHAPDGFYYFCET